MCLCVCVLFFPAFFFIHLLYFPCFIGSYFPPTCLSASSCVSPFCLCTTPALPGDTINSLMEMTQLSHSYRSLWFVQKALPPRPPRWTFPFWTPGWTSCWTYCKTLYWTFFFLRGRGIFISPFEPFLQLLISCWTYAELFTKLRVGLMLRRYIELLFAELLGFLLVERLLMLFIDLLAELLGKLHTELLSDFLVEPLWIFCEFSGRRALYASR